MVTIRLQRRGRRKRPIHHIVVADTRSPRDGRIVEDIGRFDNITPKNDVRLNEDRAIYWLKEGAQPSDTVRSILKKQGVMYKMHLMRWGKSEEEIETAMTEWREKREEKEDKVPSKKERQQAMLDAEEKEYQKQLKKKAEEAAKEKKKKKALAAEEEQKAEAKDKEVAGEAEAEVEFEMDVDAEQQKEAAETEAEEVPEEEKKKTEPADEEVSVKAAEDEEEEEIKSETEQVSTDMLAKEAISHIENTPLDELKGFVPDDESRVTVQRAMEEKRED